MTIRPYLPILILSGLSGCEFGAGTPDNPPFSKRDAESILLKNEALWNESSREYTYTYSYHSGMYASTRSGTCTVGESLACTWMDGIGESGKDTVPGRIQTYLDKIKEIHARVEPDTCYETGDGGLIVLQRVQITDSSSVLNGYAIWFNAEYGYMDSAFIHPFGPSFRIKSMDVSDRKP